MFNTSEPKNTDGVVRQTRVAITKKVPVQSADYLARRINVTKRLQVSESSRARLVFYKHLAHEDAQVRKLRLLRERCQKSTLDFVAQSFERQFQDRLQNAKASETHGTLHLPKKSRSAALRNKFRRFHV